MTRTTRIAKIVLKLTPDEATALRNVLGMDDAQWDAVMSELSTEVNV